MKTSENLTHLNIGDLWTSSVEAFHASHFQLQEKEKAKRMTVISGQKLVGLLQKSGHAGFFLKMLLDSSPFLSGTVYLKWKSWRRSFFVRTEHIHRHDPSQDYSAGSLEALFRKYGQRDMYSRSLKTEHQSFCVFQLAPSVRRTAGTVPGLLPMPTQTEPTTTDILQSQAREILLLHGINKGLIPTVTAIDSTGATAKMKSSEIKPGSMHSMTLSRFVAMLPTPMASDWKGPHRKGYIGGADEPSKCGKVTDWAGWPSQSPVCSGNDGISRQLDGITFPKWRTASIKGFGNAIVPPLAYELFQIIEAMEKFGIYWQ